MSTTPGHVALDDESSRAAFPQAHESLVRLEAVPLISAAAVWWLRIETKGKVLEAIEV
ncbi:hypothetical protein PQQ51_18175 [Paraburkholderia xenovorans]|uniref:hypothetical protein n=1 Tax=Paraburkholderia xenovorans TaxID=36873 RepID=UPI0038B8EE7D